MLDEIRDTKSREFISNLPYKLNLSESTDSALKFVVSFAKKTGDYQGLSGTDLRVIALAYRLVVEKG